ncbi:Aldose 1-epimerase [Croceitalea dokdonensis DOKDO 023]|uniref:Aldose 1-epimerase n=1 Tax=Croceitalea dokdonensis DOKDO 023 TaxID=1300341 RepID=A0A0P7AIA9_9FLAO|nr:aldose epimerase [Croceitalea dokdonensis]KPM31494.1 Aldose 1-epimerase [Croceitalea dokdonensis DOKDO 023]
MKNILALGNQEVGIEDGELVSYQVDGHEFIHQKGSPGWGSSDTEMFPVIGPVNEANFKVKTPKGYAIQDQHGLLRQVAYTLTGISDNDATYTKHYKANTPVANSKYPKKSPEPRLMWPYSFTFKKYFCLNEQGLEIGFTISGEHGMPYMLGYHPAFKLHTKNPMILAGNRKIGLPQILAVGSRALEISNCDTVVLKDKGQLRIRTEGFGHFMCWTEVDQMVCIEPITFYPYATEQVNLHKGFLSVQDKRTFRVYVDVSL